MVDVGAFVGDSAIAFARAGALVHAFEPSAALCSFIRRNVAQNGVQRSVVVHEVGLASDAGETLRRGDRLRFVEGVSYTLANLPAGVHLLKVDCEGAEYHLFADARFLAHLAPREIRMEYHHGPAQIVAALERDGYSAQVEPRDPQFGLIRGLRKLQ